MLAGDTEYSSRGSGGPGSLFFYKVGIPREHVFKDNCPSQLPTADFHSLETLFHRNELMEQNRMRA